MNIHATQGAATQPTNVSRNDPLKELIEKSFNDLCKSLSLRNGTERALVAEAHKGKMGSWSTVSVVIILPRMEAGTDKVVEWSNPDLNWTVRFQRLFIPNLAQPYATVSLMGCIRDRVKIEERVLEYTDGTWMQVGGSARLHK
jgi:hypothetical protein